MRTVNMHDAKTGLSRLVADLENGVETEVIIARNGKPVARLVPFESEALQPRRLGIAEGMFPSFDYEEFQALDGEIATQMIEGELFPPAQPAAPRRKRA